MNLRRLGLVLFVFAIGLLIFSLYITSKQSQREKEAQAGKEGQPAASQPTTKPATAPTSQPAVAAAAARPAEQKPSSAPAQRKSTGRPEWLEQSADIEKGPFLIGSLADPEGYLLQVQVMNQGASVRNIMLTGYFATVADKQLHTKDPARYEEARLTDPKKYQGHYKLLNALGGTGNFRYAFATHRLTVSGLGGRADSITWDLEGTYWKLHDSPTPDSISFRWDLARDLNYDKPDQPPKYVPYLRIIKTYAVAKNDFSIYVSLQVQNLTKDKPLNVSLDQFGPTSLGQEDRRTDYRRTAVGRFNPGGNKVEVDLKPVGDRLKGKGPGEKAEVGKSDESRPPVWVGCTNKFFASLLYVRPQEGEKQLHSPALRAKFYFFQPPDTFGAIAGVEFDKRQIAPGGEETFKLDVFTGPKKRSLFAETDALPCKAIYARLGYRSTIEIGGCPCAFDWLTWGMMWLLEKLSKLAFGNYGLGIIVLVILVRAALHPLTKKSQVSMSKMQKLAPQMQKLKEKHKDDKEALNREMMAMYKHAGATPILGCLPMFLQMPIWIALWTALNTAVELRHAGLLPVWITDLAAPDSLFTWEQGVNVPIISMLMGPIYGLNLLPLLLTVAMFLQMKMNPQTAQVAPDSAQAKQGKMMMYFMPFMMLFIFYSMPSGLNLYIMTSTFAGVAEQEVIRRHVKAKEALQAAMETTVAMPGKAARASRPKKPKGPLWFKKG